MSQASSNIANYNASLETRRKPKKFYYRRNKADTSYALLSSTQKRLTDMPFTRFSDMEKFLEGYCDGLNFTLRPAKKY